MLLENGPQWYRVVATKYAAPLDEYDNHSGPGELKVEVRRYFVTKHTPKGVRLDIGLGDDRFVRMDAKKRWACPTVKEAYESFMARNARRAQILRAQIADTESARCIAAQQMKDYPNAQ